MGAGARSDTSVPRRLPRAGDLATVLLDAPSVLGWDTRREIDARYSLGHVRASLRAAMNEGAIDKQPITPLAHILIGALNEAALLMARSGMR